MNIIRKAGETVDIERTVTDESGATVDLTGATANFYMRLDGEDVNALEKACTIASNVVSVSLTDTETATAGTYLYEIWLELDGDVDCISSGKIRLDESLI